MAGTATPGPSLGDILRSVAASTQAQALALGQNSIASLNQQAKTIGQAQVPSILGGRFILKEPLPDPNLDLAADNEDLPVDLPS